MQVPSRSLARTVLIPIVIFARPPRPVCPPRTGADIHALPSNQTALFGWAAEIETALVDAGVCGSELDLEPSWHALHMPPLVLPFGQLKARRRSILAKLLVTALALCGQPAGASAPRRMIPFPLPVL